MKATFGAGCFWGVEEAFKKYGKTTVGYMGGSVTFPSYDLVCTDTTGHAEVLQISYDPKKVSYKKLLSVFWKVHNPTQKNRQGWDVGKQYRSVIFFHNEEQHKEALASLIKEQKKYKKKIVTEIVAAEKFYPAEDYHQRYLEKKGLNMC